MLGTNHSKAVQQLQGTATLCQQTALSTDPQSTGLGPTLNQQARVRTEDEIDAINEMSKRKA